MENYNEKIKGETVKIKTAIKSKVAGYILAGFGLVASLAWNDAIKASIDHFFPVVSDGLVAKIFYALIITTVVVVVSVYIVKDSSK
ncbi:MAG: hypothetical protein COU29_04260 [Candidatus Magasanikbacteria bacterium CG10_big_fil_rev_8_21_14_0_10_36_32]|uniref:Uncharacterized protein n=1 Tax=Candidatus Magasanikbacteria bacterium CG10_big_fil_rev_8_21_14_0_10_36_32 TaxID=1974646 RepID=A0A2M6W5E8_9BACT|nr:MAG: hypothetical protein COU29_04260 [Candidatus Magasanikbacteria bacterium CG10_big_fil_rev_8_21_14_0_10_36_32]